MHHRLIDWFTQVSRYFVAAHDQQYSGSDFCYAECFFRHHLQSDAISTPCRTNFGFWHWDRPKSVSFNFCLSISCFSHCPIFFVARSCFTLLIASAAALSQFIVNSWPQLFGSFDLRYSLHRFLSIVPQSVPPSFSCQIRLAYSSYYVPQPLLACVWGKFGSSLLPKITDSPTWSGPLDCRRYTLHLFWWSSHYKTHVPPSGSSSLACTSCNRPSDDPLIRNWRMTYVCPYHL